MSHGILEKLSYVEIEEHVFTMRELSRREDIYFFGKLKPYIERMLPNLRFYNQLIQLKLVFIQNTSMCVKRAMRGLSYCKFLL